MASHSPFVREAGSGPGIVCIHSNASSSAQWRGLMDLLSRKHLVLAPDCYGSGKSSDWHSDHEITLRDEVDFIEPVFAKAGTPFALVGHSYGAAIALMAALLNPGRVRAVALYEPTLFAFVDAQRPPPNGADGIRNAARAAAEALDAGNREAAAGHASLVHAWRVVSRIDARRGTSAPPRPPSCASRSVPWPGPHGAGNPPGGHQCSGRKFPQRGLTPRSSRAPTAGYQVRSGGTQYRRWMLSGHAPVQTPRIPSG